MQGFGGNRYKLGDFKGFLGEVRCGLPVKNFRNFLRGKRIRYYIPERGKMAL